MQALKIIKRAENGSVTIPLPEEWKNSELEIIVFPVTAHSKEETDISKYRGIYKNVNAETIIRDMGEEWERDF
jgi:hypothetical protein